MADTTRMPSSYRHVLSVAQKVLLCGALGVAACSGGQEKGVTTELIADEADGNDWPSYGRTYSEAHYSPLDEISTSSISRLKLAWVYDMDVSLRADTQPLEVGGVVYATAGLSIVHALDAVTGKLLWRYDPHVSAVAGARMRPSWGARGLALWKDKVIVGTQDGRLVALNAKTGALVWSTQTLEPGNESTITGAPRVFDGKVVIGYAGGERANIRGAVNCLDADTGKFLWRFYTIPGDPAKGFENEAMAMAAKTWSGDWWKYGGGGTVWNAMTYDPELNRLYIGTGNGGPWNWKIRNPKGGDALFLASIVALDVTTGKYIWHYQQNPNEAWDYNAVMDIEMATLTIDGKARKVLMQAPKNGFFFVIDRESGKLISAEKIGRVSWASGYDLKTGRPIEKPGIRYENGPVVMWPGTFGTHNWPPMSFNPKANLAFIPTIHQADIHSDKAIDAGTWRATPNIFNTGLSKEKTGLEQQVDKSAFSSTLQAWDPVHQRQIWSVGTPGVFNGGTMTTAGGLVFQGTLDGTLNAYNMLNGQKVWSAFAGVAVLGAPITYAVGGRQYVSVMAGPPSGTPSSALSLQQAKFGWRYRDHPRRILTFVLDGKGALPNTPPPGPEPVLSSDALRPEPVLAAAGAVIFGRSCASCHGGGAVAAGGAPDLRASAVVLDKSTFEQVVHEGILLSRGMPRFDEFSARDLDSLRHFIRREAASAARPRDITREGP